MLGTASSAGCIGVFFVCGGREVVGALETAGGKAGVVAGGGAVSSGAPAMDVLFELLLKTLLARLINLEKPGCLSPPDAAGPPGAEEFMVELKELATVRCVDSMGASRR